jgi:hypothetical protein
VSQHYTICSDHFIASQFADNSKQKLKKGAVPTLFDLSSQKVPVEVMDGDQIIAEGRCELSRGWKNCMIV